MGKMVIIDEPRNLETPFSLKVGTDDAFYQGAEDFFTGALPDAAERPEHSWALRSAPKGS